MTEAQKICFTCTHSVLETYPWSTIEKEKNFKIPIIVCFCVGGQIACDIVYAEMLFRWRSRDTKFEALKMTEILRFAQYP